MLPNAFLFEFDFREAKQERLLEEVEAEVRRQREKWFQAVAFHHKKLTDKYMANWRTFSR